MSVDRLASDRPGRSGIRGGELTRSGRAIEHRHAEAVADPVDGLAQEQVADHAVAVRTDDQQVDRVVPEVADELAGGVGAVEQHRASRVAAIAQRRDQVGQVTLVGPGFAVGGLGAQNARHRRVDHVEQDQLALTGWVWARPSARLRISASAWSCSSATPILASRRGRSASTQSSFTLGLGSQAGDGGTIGLIVTQSKSKAAPPVTPYRPPATSQLNGIGPNRVVDPQRQLDPLADLVQDQLAVERHDDRGRRPGQDLPPPGRGELAPCSRRFDVKWISGITANESCKAQDHLAQDQAAAGSTCSPASEMTTTAGIRAISRVISRRSHGAIRRWR